MKPNLVTRYQMFVVSQRAKELRSRHEGTMDLQSYVEFKRNYRALGHVHKRALKAQREFWKLFMHSGTRVGMVRAQLASLESVAERAQVRVRGCACLCTCVLARARVCVYACVHVCMCARARTRQDVAGTPGVMWWSQICGH